MIASARQTEAQSYVVTSLSLALVRPPLQAQPVCPSIPLASGSSRSGTAGEGRGEVMGGEDNAGEVRSSAVASGLRLLGVGGSPKPRSLSAATSEGLLLLNPSPPDDASTPRSPSPPSSRSSSSSSIHTSVFVGPVDLPGRGSSTFDWRFGFPRPLSLS